MDIKDRRFGIVSDEPTEDMYMNHNLNKENTEISIDPEIQLLEEMTRLFKEQ